MRFKVSLRTPSDLWLSRSIFSSPNSSIEYIFCCVTIIPNPLFFAYSSAVYSVLGEIIIPEGCISYEKGTVPEKKNKRVRCYNFYVSRKCRLV
jgi:hypothetical protein